MSPLEIGALIGIVTLLVLASACRSRSGSASCPSLSC